MTQKDIDDAKGKGGAYTFKDVELNYDGDNNTTYTADEVIARMGKKEDGKYFDGNYNHDANDKFKKCSYNDFYFTGTLYQQQCTAENSAFIAPGDYIIQNNTFVKCHEGTKYGLKGFRGYFKQLPSSTSPAKGNIGICLVDRNGVVSSIHQVTEHRLRQHPLLLPQSTTSVASRLVILFPLLPRAFISLRARNSLKSKSLQS